MKKYVLRLIGWIFNDDWYNFDGALDVEGIYDSKEEALKRRDYLNYLYFLYFMPTDRRFQLNYGHNTWQNDSFLNKEELWKHLATVLDVDKNEIQNNDYYRANDRNTVWSKLDEEMVKELLDLGGFSFFELFEVGSEKMFFYQLKRNPVVWHSLKDEFEFDSDEDYYYYDSRDGNEKRRTVHSIEECYEFALGDDLYSIPWVMTSKELIFGSLSDLSKLPDMLNNLIQNSKNIEYDPEIGVISLKGKLNPKELMALDALLIDPIILTEKVEVFAIPKLENYNVIDSMEKILRKK